MNYEIWIITIYLFKKFNSSQLHSMEMSFLNCHMCFQLRICLCKCKAWIENMMATLGARLSTNIKNNFGLNFKKARCMGHLQCLHDDFENFVRTNFCNEIFWCSECTHILVIGQMSLCPSTFSFACKFCHFPPLCVVDRPRQIYYIVHRLPTIIIATIHFRVHKHLVANGKCRESMDKTKRLIAKEINCMPNAKIFIILFGANKTLLATHIFHDNEVNMNFIFPSRLIHLWIFFNNKYIQHTK
jgi:hypothetical protein